MDLTQGYGSAFKPPELKRRQVGALQK